MRPRQQGFSRSGVLLGLVVGGFLAVSAQGSGEEAVHRIPLFVNSPIAMGLPFGGLPFGTSVVGPVSGAPGPSSDEADDFPNGASDLRGGSHQGSISPVGDVDWYYFDVGTAGSVRMETVTAGDTKIYLFDSSLSLLEENDDGGVNGGSLIRRDLAPGRYYVRVDHYNDTGVVDSYTITLTLPAASGAPAASREGTIWSPCLPDKT
jgi:hypothetical protein